MRWPRIAFKANSMPGVSQPWVWTHTNRSDRNACSVITATDVVGSCNRITSWPKRSNEAAWWFSELYGT